MDYFVAKNSIIREIWGKSDTVLLIFAGAAAEFALNKAVDWLYYTGKLPADPLGRLFSTVTYARKIIFAERNEAEKSMDIIYDIHKSVEQSRGSSIPDWAYRDVLFMLIHYSIASYENLERSLSLAEKEEVYKVFYRVGKRMKLHGLAPDYKTWLVQREEHLQNNLTYSKYTKDLFIQYRKHLGFVRYFFLKEGQKLIIPERVGQLLNFQKVSVLQLILPIYKLSRTISADRLIKKIILPSTYKREIKELDVVG